MSGCRLAAFGLFGVVLVLAIYSLAFFKLQVREGVATRSNAHLLQCAMPRIGVLLDESRLHTLILQQLLSLDVERRSAIPSSGTVCLAGRMVERYCTN